MGISGYVPPKNSALIVVDVQKDFCPGGSLAVDDGDQVVEPLNAYIRQFQLAGRPIVFTRDWHPLDCEHFKTWPVHCVQNTPGAEFHTDLVIPERAHIFTKGDNMVGDAYSAFEGHNEDGVALEPILKHLGIDTLFVGGLATDYCVRATVLDGLAHKFQVNYLISCCRAVKVENEVAVEDELESKGANLLVGS